MDAVGSGGGDEGKITAMELRLMRWKASKLFDCDDLC